MTVFVMGVEYVAISCGHESHGHADLSFAVTRALYDETRRTGMAWYCPAGHRRIWTGKTTEQKLSDATARETALNDQLSASIREGELTRAALVRDRARFAAGVCPCCNRSFDNVRRHMVSKHPDFAVDKVAKPPKFRCSCSRSFDTFQGLRVHQGWSRYDGWDSPKAPEWKRHLTRT